MLLLPDILSSFEKGGHLEAGGIPSVKSFLALVFFFLECFHVCTEVSQIECESLNFTMISFRSLSICGYGRNKLASLEDMLVQNYDPPSD